MMIDDLTANLIDALLPQVGFDGWTDKSLRQALVSLGEPEADAPLYFPGGPAEMIESFCALADKRMEQAAEAADLLAYRLPARVRAIIAIRFEQNRDNKDAIRRALAVLSLPNHAPLAARLTAATIDSIWFVAGDKSADFSWYTKRVILAGVYGSTLLYWLNDSSPDDEATLRFLDRRLANVGQITNIRKTITERFSGLRGRMPRRA